MHALLVPLLALFLPAPLSAAEPTLAEITSGLKEALSRGAEGAVTQLGLLDDKDADLDRYVRQKAMDGIFLMVAEQEKSISKDSVATGSALLTKVFGFGG